MDPRHSENSRGLEEFDSTDPLLSNTEEALPTPEGPVPGARAVLFRLYTSHALSAWNSRMFEFGAVLFLASIFPGTLLYASTYALVRALSAVALSSWLGAKVDKLDRLVVLRHSIGLCDWVMFYGPANVSSQSGKDSQSQPLVCALSLSLLLETAHLDWSYSLL